MLGERSCNEQLEDDMQAMDEKIYENSPVNPQTSIMSKVVPQQHVSKPLLDFYFKNLHCLYPFLDEDIVRKSYDSMYEITQNKPKKTRRSTAALMNIIFALAEQSSNWEENSANPFMLNKFYQRAEAIMSHELLRTNSIESSNQ